MGCKGSSRPKRDHPDWFNISWKQNFLKFVFRGFFIFRPSKLFNEFQCRGELLGEWSHYYGKEDLVPILESKGFTDVAT